MRISDWSSDVCSSDHRGVPREGRGRKARNHRSGDHRTHALSDGQRRRADPVRRQGAARERHRCRVDLWLWLAGLSRRPDVLGGARGHRQDRRGAREARFRDRAAAEREGGGEVGLLKPFRLTKCRPSVPPWGRRPFFCLRAAAGATGNLRFRVKALARPTVRAEHERHVRSEEHTSELQSLMRISYAVFCLKKKNTTEKQLNENHTHTLFYVKNGHRANVTVFSSTYHSS